MDCGRDVRSRIFGKRRDFFYLIFLCLMIGLDDADTAPTFGGFDFNYGPSCAQFMVAFQGCAFESRAIADGALTRANMNVDHVVHVETPCKMGLSRVKLLVSLG